MSVSRRRSGPESVPARCRTALLAWTLASGLAVAADTRFGALDRRSGGLRQRRFERTRDPFLIFDATATVRLHDGLDVIVRPYAHRLTGGKWDAEMYQLQIRYVAATRLPLRLDAGIIASPLGLNTLELLPDTNPTIGAPFFYFAPLPRFDAHYDGVQLMSGGYPLGAIVSSSGTQWDAGPA